MLKSMTAYGRASSDTPVGHMTVEIQSVNRKFLDVTVTLPRELNQFDIELKKWLLASVARGNVTIKVAVSFEGRMPFTIRPNLTLVRELKLAWDEIAKELNLPSTDCALSLLPSAKDLVNFEENRMEEEKYREALRQTFDQALKRFIQMKIQEGEVLLGDTILRLNNIRHSMSIIQTHAPEATQKYQEKLLARLNELLPGHVENEERVLREIALFAEKIDITEEITRFFCHLTHFEELIQSTEISVGKTLEFILQELNREANTIGSKSSDAEISRAVIDIKSELERIREQIQNIE